MSNLLFKTGDMVKLKDILTNKYSKGLLPGAIGTVVDGKKTYPGEYSLLRSHIFNTDPINGQMLFDEFIFVTWAKDNANYQGGADGAYSCRRFELLHNSSYEENSTPVGNDGRHSCFWCQSSTITIQGFSSLYQICEKCGR